MYRILFAFDIVGRDMVNVVLDAPEVLQVAIKARRGFRKDRNV